MPKKIYHLTVEHLYYLLNNDCYLTFKADGIFKTYDEFNGICEYEKLNDGRELVFDYLTSENKSNTVLERLNEYCSLINFNIPEFDEITYENMEEIINKYINFYSNIKLNKIFKFYLKLKNEDRLKIISKLNDYFPEINYPTDGWVIVPKDTRYSAKIKPFNQMTIDLKYKHRNFFDSNNNIYSIEGKNFKNNSIYRCYFKDNKWYSREERKDKKYPNSKYIVDLIQNQINFKLNLNLIQNLNLYTPYYSHLKYDSEFNDFFNHIKNFTTEWLMECKNKTILDVGCGKNSSILLWKDISPKNIIGLDIDPICIFKSCVSTNSNNYIWFNINKNWNISEQINYFGKIWESSQIFKIQNLYSKFDYIIFNFSIHYSDNYKNLIKNINNFIKKGSKIKFNWIDYKNVTCFDINIDDNYVKIKLPWKNEYHSEPYFDYNNFSKELITNGWKLEKQEKIINFHDKFYNWQNSIYYETWIFN